MIEYRQSLDGLNAAKLCGFFEGWPNPPLPETHLRILLGSAHVWLAVDTEINRVVGFITALSDGVLSAYIPLLEVLPDYRGSGVGQQLLARMLETLRDLYMVDLLCDHELQAYYARFGMLPAEGCCLRRYDRQNGEHS